MQSICGMDCCQECNRKSDCGGCQKTNGHPFGGKCIAAEAFQKDGIRVVRMDDIANSLSISKRTLYELFSDKEQLLMEVFRLLNKRTADYMGEIASRADNVLEVIFAFYKRKMDELGSTNPAL